MQFYVCDAQIPSKPRTRVTPPSRLHERRFSGQVDGFELVARLHMPESGHLPLKAADAKALFRHFMFWRSMFGVDFSGAGAELWRDGGDAEGAQRQAHESIDPPCPDPKRDALTALSRNAYREERVAPLHISSLTYVNLSLSHDPRRSPRPFLADLGLLLLRVFTGALLIHHGYENSLSRISLTPLSAHCTSLFHPAVLRGGIL